MSHFNSHAHVERDHYYLHVLTPLCHFNSHAHVERDTQQVQERQLYLISTHTLTWSVTSRYNSNRSILKFQLTRSRGAWLDLGECTFFTKFISTHTLTWSVTRYYHIISADVEFQLTRSRGAWLLASPLYHFTILFQLTRSRGAWQNVVDMGKQILDFNSHAHVERDEYGILRGFTQNSFQLTRSRGAWPYRFQWLETTVHFNSHAHVERDNADETKFQEIVNFNSHAHVERDCTD